MSGKKDKVLGLTYPATKTGFLAAMLDANKYDTEGYELHTVVRLDSSLAVVFKLRGNGVDKYDSFFD